jgi:hypothetical protein
VSLVYKVRTSNTTGYGKPHEHVLRIRKGTKNLGLWIQAWRRGNSVGIVSGKRLDYRAIEVRSPAEAKGFFFYPLCPDRLWGPPSLLYNGCRGPFPRAKARPGRNADHSPPHLVPRSRMSRCYTSSPSKRFLGVYWESFSF